MCSTDVADPERQDQIVKSRMIVILSCALLASAHGVNAQTLRMHTLKTFDVPAFTAEIVDYCASERVLVSTNTIWKTLDVFLVDSLDPPAITPLDFDEDEPSEEGIWMMGEPTSVSAHPTLPVAIVAVLGRELDDRGRVCIVDLRRGASMGTVLVDQPVGIHPDSVGISPDGRWAIVANEGEGLFRTPGSITAIDLRGLTLARRPWDGPLPSHELPGLSRVLDTPVGDCEPEYVAFDPQSRFAVVSCQDNDAVVLVDLRKDVPAIVGCIFLPYGSQPDGVSVLDNVAGPDGRTGCLVGVAEEGMFDRYGRFLGNTVSFTWIDPDKLDGVPRLMSRTHVSDWLEPGKPRRRRDPENIRMARFGGRSIAIVACEQGDRLVGLDITDPTQPHPFDIVRVGDRPEGLVLIRHGNDLIAVTGDEGNEGPGEISFVRISSDGK